MPRSIRAKFRVDRAGMEQGTEIIYASPVTDGSYAMEFWEATPSGALELWINNPSAHGFFQEGREFYADFTPCEPDETED